jgi:hypothetical protein
MPARLSLVALFFLVACASTSLEQGATRADPVGGCPAGVDPGAEVGLEQFGVSYALRVCQPLLAGTDPATNVYAERVGLRVDGTDYALDCDDTGAPGCATFEGHPPYFQPAVPFFVTVPQASQRVEALFASNAGGETRIPVDHPIVLAQEPPPPPPPDPDPTYQSTVRVTLPTTGKLADATAVSLADEPEWAVRECEFQSGTSAAEVVAASTPSFDRVVTFTGDPGTTLDVRSRCKANGDWGPYQVAQLVIPTPEPPPPPPPPPTTVPPITRVELRRCDLAATESLGDFVDGVRLSKTATELGGPTCLTALVSTNAGSVGFVYEPPAGTPAPVPHPGENSQPLYLFGDPPATAGKGNLAVAGLHRAVITPCSIQVGYSSGNTCTGSGGVEGEPFELLFEYVAPPPVPPVVPDAPTVVPGPVQTARAWLGRALGGWAL